MNHPLQHDLTLQAHLTGDHSAVEIRLVDSTGQLIVGRTERDSVEAQVREIDYLLNLSWQSEPSAADEAELIRCVSELSTRLLNPAISQVLAAADGRLLMVSAPLILQRIPWELLKADRVPLGERFAIGRHVPELTGADFDALDRRYRSVHVASVATDNLTWAAWEVPAVRAALRRLALNSGGRLTPPEPATARLTIDGMLRCLSRTRWLHFAGHAEAVSGGRGWNVEPEASGRELPSIAVLTPEHVLALGACTPEVVFAHGCGTLQIPESPESTRCMVEALLRRGTRWLLGPTVPTLDNECRYLVEPFYAGMVRGLPVGEALRQARLEAIRRCPSGTARWLSYVLYGDPAECFVEGGAARSAVQRNDPPRDIPQAVRAQSERLDRPAVSNRTPIDAASVDFATSMGGVAAFGDSRTAGTPGEDGAEAESRGEPSRAEPTGHSMASVDEHAACPSELTDNRLQHFHRQMLTALAGFREYRDFRSGTVTPARLEDRTDIRGTTTWTFESFGMVRGQEARERSATSRIQCRLQSDDSGASLPEVLLSIEFVDRLKPDTLQSAPEAASGPVSAGRIDALLKERDVERDARPGSHEVRVFVSASGFDEPAVNRYCGGASGTGLPPALSVVLIDLLASRVHYRSTDLNLMPFLPLFDLSDEELSVRRVVEYVAAERPLAASLGLRTVIADLQLSEQIVAIGFRVAAAQFGLSLDDLPKHGLVLSEPSGIVGEEPAHSSHDPGLPGRKKWFRKLLSWLGAAASIWNWLTNS